jgi:hypothetical protein
MLPIEIWLYIIDILGTSYFTRDMYNLIRALKLNDSIGYRYLIRCLVTSRNIYSVDYRQQMLKFWLLTGIDDGVYASDLLEYQHIPFLFRTIWSCNMINSCIVGYPHQSYLDTEHNDIIQYTNNIILDIRKTPTDMSDFNYSSYKFDEFIIPFHNTTIYKYLNAEDIFCTTNLKQLLDVLSKKLKYLYK